ncbi:CpsB/CapC family capsule biosynthesis tyrosine phosphatase [Marinococcus luteus]|uniref:CpsB/CapC family capsule biosynthesis tyrosine phosphatase n=1 Tax=Marinococcus luteus TaxID=1122204 RepID=UPI002ACCA51E|nr:CpsB/CapC family capsule biosynthesis tyrosine phosphatase [Marinococcus luteus]MDZ5782813.1 CpsB/CapC family capsule biosynthesis tyrosine phosphatase [Marinococcus luteus]
MIDINSYILNDEGETAEKENNVRQLLAEYNKAGITDVIPAPKQWYGNDKRPGDTIPFLIEQFQKQWHGELKALRIHPGQCVRLTETLVQELKTDEALTLNNSRYVLVEGKADLSYQQISSHLYELRLEGYVPILAEPEKEAGFQHHPEELYRLIKDGSLAQVNAGSFSKSAPKPQRHLAEKMIQYRWANIVANVTIDSFDEGPSMEVAFDSIEKIAGGDYAQMLIDNTECVLHNQYVSTEEPFSLKEKRKWFMPSRSKSK